MARLLRSIFSSNAARFQLYFFLKQLLVEDQGNLLDRISFDRPSNSCTLFTDSDGVQNSFDLDSDGDGILDATEGGTA